MKIWRGDENTDDKIIAMNNSVVYKGNPQNAEINHCINELMNGIIPKVGFIGIPLSYLKEIRQQEGRDQIELFFGRDSEEHLKIKNDIMRNDIFNYFKENLSGANFSIDRYSKLRAGKKPLIALGVVMAIFFWTLPYAIGYDNGEQYEITNGHYNSLTGIVLAIASAGVRNVIVIFGSLMAIALITTIRKMKNPPVINRIVIRR